MSALTHALAYTRPLNACVCKKPRAASTHTHTLDAHTERQLEEQEALDKKLKTLQTFLTGDNVGLVSSVGEHGKGKEPQTQGHFAPSPPPQRVCMDSVSSRSQSISSASSPRGSIPSMPSRPESPQFLTSLTSKHTSPAHLAGPSTTTSSSQAKAQPLIRYGPMVNATAGSSASSFSDLRFPCSRTGNASHSHLVTLPEASLNFDLRVLFRRIFVQEALACKCFNQNDFQLE